MKQCWTQTYTNLLSNDIYDLLNYYVHNWHLEIWPVLLHWNNLSVCLSVCLGLEQWLSKSASLLLFYLFLFFVCFSHVLQGAFGKKTGFALLCNWIILLKYRVSPLKSLNIKNETIFFLGIFLPSRVDFAGITLSRCCCPLSRSSVFEHTGCLLEVERVRRPAFIRHHSQK